MPDRVFRWCPEEVAHGCYLDVPHSHVAIKTPGGSPITPKCGRRTLNLFFHDLDPEAIRRTEAFMTNPVKGNEIIANCFTEAQAKALAAFVEAVDGLLVVNCEAGISRSPGVVLALRRRYGGDTEECFEKAHPNIHVASMLGRALGVGPFEARKYNGPDWFCGKPSV